MKAFPQDIEVAELKTRHIGIENELGSPTPQGIFRQELDKTGLFQSYGFDGGGIEFRTVPISTKALRQVRGKRFIQQYYQEISERTEVIESGGTHIHISILDTDKPFMEAHATAMGVAFFEQLQKISGRDTHWAQCFGRDTLDAIGRTLRSLQSQEYPRRYARVSSMLNPTRHKTLEFRGPKGSNNCHEVLAWAELLENIVKRSNRKSIQGVKFRELLKGEHLEAYVSQLDGWRQLTDEDLNKTINVNALRA